MTLSTWENFPPDNIWMIFKTDVQVLKHSLQLLEIEKKNELKYRLRTSFDIKNHFLRNILEQFFFLLCILSCHFSHWLLFLWLSDGYILNNILEDIKPCKSKKELQETTAA